MSERINLARILDEVGPEFAGRSATLEAEDRFVGENYEALREHRVFSAPVPQDHGGGGATHGEMCDFLRRLARHCPSTALALSMHQHLVAAAAANDRAGRPGRKLLEKVAGAEAVLVSTGANDWLDSNGSAERVEGGFRVSAVKPFASGSPAGNAMVTSVAFDDPEAGPQVLHFSLPLDAEGVEFLDDWRAHGMRATGSQTIRLDRAFVPDEAIVLRRARGPFRPAFAVILTVAMPLIVSAYLGTAEEAVAIARERARGKGGDPGLPILVGEMDNALVAAELARDDMVRLAAGYDFAPSAGLASAVLVRKTLAARAIVAAVDKALEVAGGSGFMRKAGIERRLRDARGVAFHPLPEKRQQLFTGRLAMGLDPVSGAVTEEAGAAAA